MPVSVEPRWKTLLKFAALVTAVTARISTLAYTSSRPGALSLPSRKSGSPGLVPATPTRSGFYLVGPVELPASAPRIPRHGSTVATLASYWQEGSGFVTSNTSSQSAAGHKSPIGAFASQAKNTEFPAWQPATSARRGFYDRLICGHRSRQRWCVNSNWAARPRRAGRIAQRAFI